MNSPNSPDSSLPGGLPDHPTCPFCKGRETEVHSIFGAHASVSTYWCRSCRSPFEFMKWGRSAPGTAEPPHPEEEGDG
ncbi:MAG: hypothetical protein EA352_08685 [Gemmatimonadales bacterium]|nr:MAG: hypothetical protein EA352_08685 [Gemmatimonadales bacterium]